MSRYGLLLTYKSLPGYSSSRETVLVYSSDTPEKVREYQKLGREKVAAIKVAHLVKTIFKQVYR